MLRPILTTLCALVLAACQMTAPDADGAAPSPITGGEIIVTPLDVPPAKPSEVAEPVTKDQPAPLVEEPATDAVADAGEALPEEALAPVLLKSPEQIQCEKQGGTWARAGKSVARTCVKQTRDGGKQCSRGSQCEGLCLARSGTCAPLAPLFGCNEIFEDDGRRMTLCID